MKIVDPLESQRIGHLLESASKAKCSAAKDLNDEQVNSAAGRKEYFEKLALGSGAAIAAIVSFVGTHSGRLQPPWLLRCSLVSLVVGVIAALYRNFRHPVYILEARRKLWLEASLTEQQCKREYFLVNPNTIDMHTGQRIDGVQWAQDAEASDVKAKELIDKLGIRVERLIREWQGAENVCLIAIGIAMVSLVWLAIINF